VTADVLAAGWAADNGGDGPGEEVPRVQPVDVDVVGPQPPQTLLEVPDEALAVVTAAVRIVRVEGQGILRAEHELLTPAREELTEELMNSMRVSPTAGRSAGGKRTARSAGLSRP